MPKVLEISVIGPENKNQIVKILGDALVGRLPSEGLQTFSPNDIPVKDANPKTFITLSGSFVSRVHAFLRMEKNEARVWDLSKNGIFLNAEKVKDAVLKDGDCITIGDDIDGMYSLNARIYELPPNYSSRCAFLVGGYSEGLPGNEEIITEMAGALRARGFLQSNIIRLKRAALGKFIGTLRLLRNRLGESSLFVFYFSGHGMEDGSLTFNPGFFSLGKYKTLHPKALLDEIDRLPGNKIILLDSCFSGKVKDAYGLHVPTNTLLIASSKANQKSFNEFRKGRHIGRFTDILLELLHNNESFINLKALKKDFESQLGGSAKIHGQEITLVGKSIVL